MGRVVQMGSAQPVPVAVKVAAPLMGLPKTQERRALVRMASATAAAAVAAVAAVAAAAVAAAAVAAEVYSLASRARLAP